MFPEDDARQIVHDETVAAGQPWSCTIKTGQSLQIVDLEGRQGVDFLCYNARNTAERYHAPNTLKAALELKLTTGHVLYSDEARPIFTITADTCGYHDTIAGCCSVPSNKMLYGVPDCSGCRENFLNALDQHGMDRRDIVPNINFFCNVPVASSRFADTVFMEGLSKPGDYVELLAEMDALAVISNCPQMNNPCNSGAPTPIRVRVLESF